MSDTLFCGKRFRTLNVFDEGVREALAIEVDTSLPAERVIRLLEQLKDSHPPLQADPRRQRPGIHLLHIQPGKPAQNAYVERFNRSFRNEVLDAHLFSSLSEVRELVHNWLIDYNEERPHDSLGNLPPALFRKNLTNPRTGPNLYF